MCCVSVLIGVGFGEKPSKGEIIGVGHLVIGGFDGCVGAVEGELVDLHGAQRMVVVPQVGHVTGKPSVRNDKYVAVVLFGHAVENVAFDDGAVDVCVEDVVLASDDDVDPFVEWDVVDVYFFVDDVEGVHHDDECVGVGCDV